jgi:hypothetical protein
MATQTNKSNSGSNRLAPKVLDPEIISDSLKVTRPMIERLSKEGRHESIALAAYYLAERRGFEPGHEEEDWLAAEGQAQADASTAAPQ